MSSSSSSSPREPERKPAHPVAARRLGLAERRLVERRAARARIAARLVHPPSAEQRAFDPLLRGRLALGFKLLIAAAAIVLSSALHAGVYGVGSWLGFGKDRRREKEVVAIELHVREPEPEKPPPPPPLAQELERMVKQRPERPKAEPPPDRPPPPEEKGKPPPRVVGFSLDSTAQGGSGPSFSVGNTREGVTPRRAADPGKVARVPPPPPPSNQKASRIPGFGVKYLLPRRLRPIKPPYPEKLQTQEIEAAVTVMVKLDETGKVTSVAILKGSGYAEFDEAARKTALAESFTPATRDGTPIPYTLTYTYRFTMEDR